MKTVVVKGQKREALGKKDSKKLRSEEKVPAVLYGGAEPVHFSIDFNELRPIVYTPSVYLIDLDIDGEVHKAMMQDIQWHAVEEQALHVDFLRISEDKPVKIEVPVQIEGFAKGTREGGKLSKNLRRLKVKALAKDLPDTIKVDVTELGLGQSIKVGEVEAENLELLDAKSNVIVTVAITRAAKSAAGSATADSGNEAEEAAEE